MCLRTVSKRIPKPSRRAQWAWKVFVERPRGRLRFPFFFKGKAPVRYDVWMQATVDSIFRGTEYYAAGFHVWARKVDALMFVDHPRYLTGMILVRVKVRKIRTIGTQHVNNIPVEVWVADEMMVPTEEVEKAKAKR